MANGPGYNLPTNPEQSGGRVAKGFVTPVVDRIPQVHSIPPTRVLPIIFLPGIMGTNLRLSKARQTLIEKSNNIAWRPDRSSEALDMSNASAKERQLLLDPNETEVDSYDPSKNLTGCSETSDERNDNIELQFTYLLEERRGTPLLIDDPFGSEPRRTATQKARARGWGEVYFDSYYLLLSMCEVHLNTAFFRGRLQPFWKSVIGIAPSEWRAHPQFRLTALDEESVRGAVRSCWFPVHAMGYNWLQSNKDSGMLVARRIDELIKNYQGQGFQCEKVILVTHSMGGLVARAVIHPEMGNLNDKILGVVHGVMPAIGAGATYKRIRCGFEGGPRSIPARVLGYSGDRVTAVLANSQGGLELLPNQAYGNDWLSVTHKGGVIHSLPKKGDPYEEIYKVDNKWFALLRKDWINLAGLEGPSFRNTGILLDKAKTFHNSIRETYHSQSYAHYGADREMAAWHNVVWTIDAGAKVLDVENLNIAMDNGRGKLKVIDPRHPSPPGESGPSFGVKLEPPDDPGDGTVPLHSAEAQLHSGKFKGIFRQVNYEHQDSYKDPAALNSTLYCLIRIAQSMTWSTP